MFGPLRKLRRSVKQIAFSLYNSTLFLAVLNFLLVVTIIKEYKNKQFKRFKNTEFAFPSDHQNSSFIDDVLYALNAINYIQDQKLGRIRPIPEDFNETYLDSHSCLFFPPKFRLGEDYYHNNKRSQWTEVGGRRGFLAYLFGAYWDDRPNELFARSYGVVHILAMVRRGLNETDPYHLYCQMWSEHGSFLESTKAYAREIWRKGWDPRRRFYQPVLISCPVQKSSSNPGHITLLSGSSSACEQAHYSIPIYGYNKPVDDNKIQKAPATKLKVVVCVKGMDFIHDQSLRLAEWIELQLIFGADKIVIYTYYVHPRTQSVIKYYMARGKVEQIELTLPGDAPQDPYLRSRFIWRNRQQKRRNELIPYNDCLYRHLHSHDYLLIVDTDEIVVPLASSNWSGVLMKWQNDMAHLFDAKEDEKPKFTAFSVRNVFFFDNVTNQSNSDIPEYMHMLRHNVRAKKISEKGNYGKSFMNIRNVATVFNHFPLHKQSSDVYKTRYVSHEDALKLHYKGSCPVESRDECPSLYANTIVDNSLDEYKVELIGRVQTVARYLNLL